MLGSSVDDERRKMLAGFLPLIKKFDKVIHAVTLAGGKFIFVGGCVRDVLLGIESKDYDAEVYGLSPDKLHHVLQSIDKVNLVGKSFGVFKLTHYPIDISLPRLDQKIGAGHRGFSVKVDYTLTFKQAAKRRDLTINSIGYDPLQKKLLDPYGGQKDLHDKILRAVDPKTFVEDPLRALRVAQFSARFKMQADPPLIALCRTFHMKELPAERILEEFKKLFLKGQIPSLGLDFLYEASLISQLFPPLFLLQPEQWRLTLKSLDKGAHQLPPTKGFILMMGLFVGQLSREKALIVIKSFQMPQSMEKAILKLLSEFNSLKEHHFLYNKKADYLWSGYYLHKEGLSWRELLWIVKQQEPPVPTFKQLTEKVLQSGAMNPENLTPVVQGIHLLQHNIPAGQHFKKILLDCLSLQFEKGEKNPEAILKHVLSEN